MPSPAQLVATAITGLGCMALITGCATSGPSNGPAAASASVASSASPSASHAGSATVPSACSVVTEQDATTALGADPGAGVAQSQSDVTACTYGAGRSMVSVHVLPTGKAEFDKMHAATSVDLSGIGDAAFGIFQPPVASIAFYRGSSYVFIVIVSDGSQDTAVALATTAASRL